MNFRRGTIRWIGLSILCAVLFLGQAAAADTKLKDVPPDHWAYQSIKYLVDKGYLSVYQDDTFQGAKPVDRYTFATILARILKDIEAGKVAPTAEDKDLLKKLTDEFREELVTLAEKVSAVEGKLEQTTKVTKIQGDEITKLAVGLGDVVKQAQGLEKRAGELERKLLDSAGALSERISKNAQDIQVLRGISDDTRAGLANLEKELADLTSEAKRLGSDATSLAARVDALSGKLADQGNELEAAKEKISALEGKDSDLGAGVENLTKESQDLKKELNSLLAKAQGIEDRVSQLEGVLSGKIEEVSKALTEAQADIATQARATADKLGEELAAQGGKIAGLEERDLAHDKAIEGLKSQDTALGQAIDGLKAQDAALGQAIEGLKARDTASDQAIEGLKAQDTALNQAIEGLKSQDTTHGQAITALEGKVKAQEDAIQALRDELAGQKKGLEDLATELRSAKEEFGKAIDGVRASLDNLTSRVAGLEERTSKNEEGLAALNGQVKSLSEQLASIKGDLEARVDAERVARLSGDSLLQDRVNKLTTDLGDLQAKMDKQVKDLEGRTNTIMILAGILGLLGFLVK